MDIDAEIASWRETIRTRSGLGDDDVQELEDHLRDEMEALQETGLSVDEALLIGMRRMGNSGQLAGELARVDSDRVWRYFFEPDSPKRETPPREIAWIIVAALGAAALGKVPLALGVPMQGPGLEVYLRNLALFVVPIMMVFYFFRNRYSSTVAGVLITVVLGSALAANTYPFAPGSQTSFLMVLHLPLLLWLAFGLAYCGDEWMTMRAPLDFIRFSGEFVIYSVLILCGGVVLVGLVQAVFQTIGMDIDLFVRDYLALSGLLATPVVAAYLVEKKRSLIENLAPVLARIFIPLFLLMTVSYIVVVAVQHRSIMDNREMLITLDLLLLLVVGMVLYDLSARRVTEPFSLSHAVNLMLIAAALVIDAMALYGIVGRLGAFGFTANKTAALGENVLLMGNLVGLAITYVRFGVTRGSLHDVLNWQVKYLPAYVVWLAFAVFLLPPIFGYR